jgi:hypothetical protein
MKNHHTVVILFRYSPKATSVQWIAKPQGDSMSTTPSSSRSKRPRSTAAPAGAAKRPTPNTAAVTRSVSAEQRNAMIAESAYLRAEARGFQGGDPLQDWLEGEKEVDALLSRAAD